MSLIVTENFEPKHIDAVQHVPRVPSRREAEKALARIIAALSFCDAEMLEQDIEILRGFVWSR